MGASAVADGEAGSRLQDFDRVDSCFHLSQNRGHGAPNLYGQYIQNMRSQTKHAVTVLGGSGALVRWTLCQDPQKNRAALRRRPLQVIGFLRYRHSELQNISENDNSYARSPLGEDTLFRKQELLRVR